MTTLLLIRHGQSEANIKNLFAGHTDAELSPLGKQQAQVTARYIKDNYQVDRVYASDLQRAYETGKATADRYGLEVIAVEGMREIFGGDWENLSYELLEKKYAEAYDIWLHDVGNSQCVAGESVRELGERVYNTLLKIAADNDGKTVVVATHATPVRVAECLCRNLSMDEMKNIPWVSNASVTELQYDAGNWTIVKRGYDEHLMDLRSALPANV